MGGGILTSVTIADRSNRVDLTVYYLSYSRISVQDTIWLKYPIGKGNHAMRYGPVPTVPSPSTRKRIANAADRSGGWCRVGLLKMQHSLWNEGAEGKGERDVVSHIFQTIIGQPLNGHITHVAAFGYCPRIVDRILSRLPG